MSNTDFGYSQDQLADGSSDLNAIFAICRNMIAQLDVMKLVKVVSVTAGSGTPPTPATITVQPLVSQIDGNGYAVPHGNISGIPCARIQGGTAAIIVDPVAGDVGYVVCADRDSSVVVASGTNTTQNPGSRRRYNISDGVYCGSLLNSTAPTSYVWLKTDGTFVVSDKNNNVVESTSAGIDLQVAGEKVLTMTSSEIDLKIGGTTILSLTASLANFSVNVQATDFVTSTLTSYVDHTHTVASTPGESDPPTAGT
jgi:hypothetical protein